MKEPRFDTIRRPTPLTGSASQPLLAENASWPAATETGRQHSKRLPACGEHGSSAQTHAASVNGVPIAG